MVLFWLNTKMSPNQPIQPHFSLPSISFIRPITLNS